MNWLHFWLGPVLYLSARLAQLSPVQAGVFVLAIFVAHEIGDGDFRVANGGPANGIRDVASSLPLVLFLILLESLL